MDEYYRDVLIVLGISLALLAGSCYTMYRLGRRLERRDLTMALIAQTTDIYQDGLEDGRIQGYKKCMNEDYEIKDKY